MAYGIQVFGDSGFAQIDQDYSNFGLLTQGVVSVAQGVWDYTPSFTAINFPDTGVRPMVFVRSPSNGAFAQLREIGNTFARFGLLTPGDHMTYVAGTLEYRVYAPLNSLSSNDSYGMTVYRPDGQLSFHSGVNFMRVHTVATINTTAPSVAVLAPANPFFQLNQSPFVHREISMGGIDGLGTNYVGSSFKYASGTLYRQDAVIYNVADSPWYVPDIVLPLQVLFLK